MDYDWRTWASSSENIHMAAYTGGGEKHPKMIIFQILDAFVLSSQQLGLDQTRNWRGMWRQSRLYWLRTSWVTLNISRWFVYFDLFQMSFFTLNFSRWLYLLLTLPDDFIFTLTPSRWFYLLWTLADDGPAAGGVEVQAIQVEEKWSRQQETWIWKQVLSALH